MRQPLKVIIITAIFWQMCGSLTLAETITDPNLLDKFPPSPLEITEPDPLLPRTNDKQPLTASELQNLDIALDRLNQEAQTKLQQGDKEAAFEIWNRELRLRRYFGTVAEVEALTRVGEIAWNQNQRTEVRYVTERLKQINKTLSPKNKPQKTIDIEVWRSLGIAYQKLRVPKLALENYNQLLILVRQQQDADAELETLKTIGELHLSWFDYPKAASTYEELLSLATKGGDKQNEIAYSQKLVYIYTQDKQPQQTINLLGKILNIYVSKNDLIKVPDLYLAIGSNYEILAQNDIKFRQEAFSNYQQAYTNAWKLKQYATSGVALRKLIALYYAQGQISEALQTTQILVDTESLSNNFYELMQAYDQMGKLYLELKRYPQALTAFQNGLELAIQLKHEEKYFTEQIESLSKTKP